MEINLFVATKKVDTDIMEGCLNREPKRLQIHRNDFSADHLQQGLQGITGL